MTIAEAEDRAIAAWAAYERATMGTRAAMEDFHDAWCQTVRGGRASFGDWTASFVRAFRYAPWPLAAQRSGWCAKHPGVEESAGWCDEPKCNGVGCPGRKPDRRLTPHDWVESMCAAGKRLSLGLADVAGFCTDNPTIREACGASPKAGCTNPGCTGHGCPGPAPKDEESRLDLVDRRDTTHGCVAGYNYTSPTLEAARAKWAEVKGPKAAEPVACGEASPCDGFLPCYKPAGHGTNHAHKVTPEYAAELKAAAENERCSVNGPSPKLSEATRAYAESLKRTAAALDAIATDEPERSSDPLNTESAKRAIVEHTMVRALMESGRIKIANNTPKLHEAFGRDAAYWGTSWYDGLDSAAGYVAKLIKPEDLGDMDDPHWPFDGPDPHPPGVGEGD